MAWQVYFFCLSYRGKNQHRNGRLWDTDKHKWIITVLLATLDDSQLHMASRDLLCIEIIILQTEIRSFSGSNLFISKYHEDYKKTITCKISQSLDTNSEYFIRNLDTRCLLK